jgi:hypothetical protein
MKLKRDITSSAAPAPNQIEVGELAINAKTGILYSKLADGTVIKWLGAPVCETDNQTICPVPVPEISTSDITNFCCNGDSLTVNVSNLLVNHRYKCSIKDISTGESSTFSVSPESSQLLPLNKSDRSAVFNINLVKEIQPIAFIKISIHETIKTNNVDIDMLRSEKIVTICCTNCSG